MKLPFQRQIFAEMCADDALLVLGSGLGLDDIMAAFISLYVDSRCLVLLINASAEDERRLVELLIPGCPKPGLRVITNEVTSQERLQLYLCGGVFSITSRVLVVDLLTLKIPSHLITGILVANAHRIDEFSNEAFILKLYREQNKEGFVKAFSDSPTSLTGLGRLELVMRSLHIKKVFVWPRFDLSCFFSFWLSKLPSFQMNISSDLQTDISLVEFRQALTPQMTRIQSCLIDILASCLSDLKSCKLIDPDIVTPENALRQYFESTVRFQNVDNLNYRARQTLSDIRVIRRLSHALLRLDCVSFYSFLNTIVSSECMSKNSSGVVNVSSWLFLAQSDILFKVARDRVYRVSVTGNEVEPVLEENPKFPLVGEIIDEILDEAAADSDDLTMIFVSDSRTGHILRDYISSRDREKHGRSAQLLQAWKRYTQWNKRMQCVLKSSTAVQPPPVEVPRANKRVRRTRGGSASATGSVPHAGNVSVGKDIHRLEAFFNLPQPIVADEDLEHDIRDMKFDGEFTILGREEQPAVIIMTNDEIRSIFKYQPRFIILFDPVHSAVREIECFKAISPGRQLRVYFCMYENSLEEQMYLDAIKHENDAFEALIRTKSVMNVFYDHEAKNVAPSDISAYAPKTKRKPIIVDMREFRAQLPFILHLQNFKVIPQTIEVGDYILSPDIAVERKAPADLSSSLRSGRLYEQAKKMCLNFKVAILLIETEKSLPTDDMNKLILLTLHFPGLRIIWSPSPHATCEIFHDLIVKHKSSHQQQDDSIDYDAEALEALNNSLSVTRVDGMENMIPCTVLQKMPGMAVSYAYITRKLKNIAEVCAKSVGELDFVLENRQKSELLHKFLTNEV